MNKLNNFKIKTIPEDFIVNESLINIGSSEGDYSICKLTKKGITTFDAIEKLSSFFKIDRSRIGFSGLKDEDGITTQHISLYKVDDLYSKIKSFNLYHNSKDEFIVLSFLNYSCEPCRIGDLIGNAFRVRIRDLEKDNSIFLSSCHKLLVVFPNYYDSQRFGLPDRKHVNHLIGEALMNNNLERALNFFEIGGNLPNNCNSEDKQTIFSNVDIRKKLFFCNAYSSFLFNEVLRKKLNNCECVTYCIAQDHSISIPINLYDKSLSSLLHCTLPYTQYFTNPLEEIVGEEKQRQAIVAAQVRISAVYDDELNIGKNCVDLDFFLPSGSYATVLLKSIDAILNNNVKV